MFPYKSSSNEISSKANAFVQNCKDDVEESGVPTQSAALTVGTCSSNECAALAGPVQHSSNQVPDMRDTTERTNNTRGEAVEVQQACVSSVSSTSLQVITSTAAQSTTSESTVEHCLNPKEAMPSVAPTLSASQVDTGSMSIVEPLHTGCDPCGCCNHHVDDNCASCSKSEALCQAPTGTAQLSVEGVKGLSPMSVISSSSGQVAATEVELYPPSPSTNIGAQQGSIASDHGSSSSNSLRDENCAQSPSGPQAQALAQALAQAGSPGENVEEIANAAQPSSACSPGSFVVGQPGHHQKGNAVAVHVQGCTATVASATATAVDTQRQSTFLGQFVTSREVSTGALSDQDNNCNVKAKDSNNSVKEHSHSQMGGGETRPASASARRLPPFTNNNIPEAGGSLVSQAIHATVQGINDSSNPPASFNTSGNVRSSKLDAKGASPDDDAARRAPAMPATPAATEEIYSSDKSDDDSVAVAVYKDWNANAQKNDGVLDSTDDKFQCASRSVCPNANADGLDAKASAKASPEAPKYKLKEWTYLDGPASNKAWGIPRWAGLRGGGEMSLNNGTTTSWGTPPSGNSNANNSNNNTANNQGGQAQWGGPAPNNNNRPNAGASQGSSSQPNAGLNNPANKGANPQSASGVGGVGAGSQAGGVGAQQPPGPPGPPGPGQGPGPQQGPGPGPGVAAGPAGQAQPNQPPPSTSQPPPPSQNGSNSWAQAAGGNQAAPTVAGAPGPANNASPAMPPSAAAAGSTPSTKQQLEQLNTMREALFSQDGWGGQNVNQDTGWDIPSSPEPATKDNNGGSPVWKPNVNNGTDLWELTLRHNGQPPPQSQPKVPWVHTPATNIGGTWGEDDIEDIGDSSNMWTGVPSHPISPAVPQGGPQWGGGNGGPAGPGGPGPGPAGGMWGPKKDDWGRGGGGGGGGGSNWGEGRPDPRGGGGDPRMEISSGVDPRDMRAVSNMDPRDMRGDPRDMRPGGGMVEMRPGPMDPMRSDSGMRDPRDMRVMGDNRGGDSMMRGDHRGISGRLNGAVDDPSMWPRPLHHNMLTQSQPPQKMVGPGGVGSGGGHFPGGVNQWAAPPPKDMGMSGGGGGGGGSSKASGWEEPSPPAQRRNIPNYDDGTSLWSQQQNRMGGGSKVSHWKEMPSGNMSRGMQCPPGMPQNHMQPGNNGGNMKPDGPMWPHASRNGSWEPQPDSSAPWAEDGKGNMGAINNWNEPPSWSNLKQQKNPMPAAWPEGDAMDASSSWAHPPKPGPKQLTKEMVWNSKQFRVLTEMGFKKEDVENALRVSNLSMEDSLELLNANRLHVEAWRSSGRDEHTPFDIGLNHPGGNSGPGGFSTRVLAPSAPPMPFAPPKMLNQQPPPQQGPSTPQAAAAAAAAAFNQSQRNPQSQRSNQQIRMLVQQIQMAVHAGYLNNQFLNQPLAPATLVLLNQLLQQIKILQQLSQQHTMAAVQKAGSNAVLQMSVQITKTKQYIANLQNQIVAQQAIYVKQHQHQVPPQNPDFFKQNMHDPMSALPTNFADLAIKDPQVVSEQSFQGQQSRLNQWKLPSLDKEGDVLGNEFSRAPGTTSKTPGLTQSHSSPNINPLLSQGDGPWSSVARSNSDTGWPDAPNADVPGQPDKDWPISSQSNSAAFTDLVPEFEPGKPWKGNQMKSIEDDPSITPGSVVRSPLSLNATLKDTEIFSSGGMGKTSPTSSTVDMAPPLSLSSSTWSYPASSTASAFTSPLGKHTSRNDDGGEMWRQSNRSDTGPGGPGGAGGAGGGGQAGGAGAGSNGWGNVVARSATTPTSSSSWGMQGGGAGSGSGGGGAWGSTWLLLKNLTPQIDGSTLKTLCIQHGPLQSFHLYLNHGIALAKYNTREEANKAQGALNNCVLGNTTIFAESPGESEAHALLSHLAPTSGQQQGGSAPNWNRGSGAPAAGAAVKVSSQSSQDAWNSGGGSGAGGSSGGGNAGGGGGSGGGSQLWTNNPATSSLWSAPPMDGGADQHRATPSSLNSFLPGDLLGGESM